MINYTFATAFFGIATVVFILFLIKKHSFYVRYTFWWISICAAILLFSIFPKLSDIIVGSFGISYPPSFFFFAAILMLFVKILFMDIERSKQEIRIRRLVQRLGMVEASLAKERGLIVDEGR